MRLLDFLLAPAAALMARLGFSGKFLLLGGLLAAMAVALVAQVALDADRRLDRALAQVAGVEYLKALRRVIDPVQQHRGLSQAAARGDAAAREKLAGRRDAVEAAIAAVDALEARLAGSLGTRASWERAKGAWAALRAQAPGLAAADSFRRHTEVVEVLIEHLDHVADGSGVALTTSAEIFHLADALAFKLPAATEMAGRLRGRGSGAVATGRLAEGEGALLLALAAGARDPLEQMRKSLDDYGDTQGADRDRVRAALDAGIGALADVEKEIAWMAEKGAPRLDAQAYFQLATRPIDTGNALADDLGARLEAQVRREAAGLAARRNATVLACALALVVAALLFAATYRSLRAAVGAVREAARALAAGDLTATARVAGRDELAEVAASFNDVAASFRGVVERITREAGTVASTAQDLSAASSQVATATSQQSEAAASMAASVEQMTVSIDHLRQHSGEVLKVSQHAGELSQEGSASVGAAAAEMAAIAEGARSLAGVIDRLGTESAQISRIVQVIGEIASQTNLLALNAAIEAARAGEQGRGFSVVADEVRKLAERTTQSTQEIARMVEAIQGGTGEAVAFVRRWSEKVGDGERRAQEAGGAMREVEADATRAAAAVTEIAGALAEQSSASSQIAQNVERIAQMSEENNAAVGAMADNAQRLDGLAGQLMALVGRFRLQGAPVPAAGD